MSRDAKDVSLANAESSWKNPRPRMPPGIPYIIGNEAAERFSFYGMKAILVTFMTKFLLDATGNSAFMTDDSAKEYYHHFVAAAYLFPLLGGPLSDIWLGKYRTIITLSLVYCLGHLALALDETRLGLFVGLGLIAIGAGGIKPCVSSHVGDQFDKSNSHLLEKVFGWFYISINLGAAISSLLTPWLLEEFPGWLDNHFPHLAPDDADKLRQLGPHVAFGVPGVLMLVATIVFWMGRHKFIQIPPRGLKSVVNSLKGEGGWALVRLLPLYACVAIFWTLYDQTGSSWVLQADHMNREFLGVKWHSAQIQAINPVLILLLVPLFSWVIYPAVGKIVKFGPLRRVAVGMFLIAGAFALIAHAEHLIQVQEAKPLEEQVPVSIYWQLAAYVVLTTAEVMVSVTCLEFSYTQAPREMKSFIMALYLASTSFGNEITALVNYFIQNADNTSKLPGASYYWFFTGLMIVASLLFIPFAVMFKEKTYLREEGETP